jgi:hypothetical protein
MFYGFNSLAHPFFSEDIGMSMMKRMYPTTIDPLYGPDLYMSGVTMNPGQPLADSYETPKQKREGNILKTIAAGLILAGLGFFGIKKGAALTQKAISSLTSPFKSAWQSLKGLFK